LAFVIPVVLLAIAFVLPWPLAALVSVLAAISQFAGMLVERWLFFAEARHSVTLYYGLEPTP
jgi:DMSO reductase anchor subunit